MPVSQSIQRMLTSPAFQGRLREIKAIAESELQQAIWRYVYQAYTPKEYERTYQLLNSITSTDIRIEGNTISFKVILDPEKMDHFSVVDGEPTYVPPLIEFGHHENGYETVDNFHVYEGRKYLEKAVEEIQKDMNTRVQKAVITMLTSKKYR